MYYVRRPISQRAIMRSAPNLSTIYIEFFHFASLTRNVGPELYLIIHTLNTKNSCA